MVKQDAQEELRNKMVELAKLFYETGYIEILSSMSYIEIGCSYSGEINPMEIHIFYKKRNKPE